MPTDGHDLQIKLSRTTKTSATGIGRRNIHADLCRFNKVGCGFGELRLRDKDRPSELVEESHRTYLGILFQLALVRLAVGAGADSVKEQVWAQGTGMCPNPNPNPNPRTLLAKKFVFMRGRL